MDRCLNRDITARPTAKDLLEDKFLKGAEIFDTDCYEFLQKVNKKIEKNSEEKKKEEKNQGN